MGFYLINMIFYFPIYLAFIYYLSKVATQHRGTNVAFSHSGTWDINDTRVLRTITTNHGVLPLIIMTETNSGTIAKVHVS